MNTVRIPIDVEVHSEHLVLEPLTLAHVEELSAGAEGEPELFAYLNMPQPLRDWLKEGLLLMKAGKSVHYVMRLRTDDSIIGHTSVVGIMANHRRCEIAWTWIFQRYQRRGYGRESKLALYPFLMSHGIVRVQMLADEKNVFSIRSMEKSGAKREGILRKNRIRPDGSWQNSVLYSIVDSDLSANLS